MDKIQPDENIGNIKNQVMARIKEKKICIASQSEIFAKKLGLECAIIVGILGGAFLFSVSFYIFQKTKILKFLHLGFPGLKVFLLAFPFGYVALFVGVLMFILYISNKLDLSYQTKKSSCFVMLALLGSMAAVVVFLILADMHKMFENLAKNKIPKNMAVDGRVKEISSEKIIVEEEDGEIVELEIQEGMDFGSEPENILGKHMRAVGQRDSEESRYFHVENILCCDND